MQGSTLASVRENNISDSLIVEVRNMIVEGRLPAGERINEVHLAQLLGISRTPLREALHRLAHEGALTSAPRIGYFVRPLTLEEFREIYPIRPLLDPEALRLAGVPGKEHLQHLREINERLERASGANAIIELDDEWHLELLVGCKNKVLLDLIEQFIQRTRRYEIALMNERKNVSRICTEHRRIMTALSRKDLKAACAALASNLRSGYAPIVSWLEARTREGS